MFDDMLKSIRAQLYERAVSPLMSSLLISWSVWNYKFILLIFSGVAITEKFRIIDEVLFSSVEQIYLQGMIYPIITSLVYIYIYPYPARRVYQFSRNRQKEISDIKRQIEDETLLTAKESRSIRREIYAVEEENQKELERKNYEIEKLKLEIEGLEKKKSVKTEESLAKDDIEVESDSKLNSDVLPEDQLQILRLVGDSLGEFAEKQVIKNFPGSHVTVKYNLQELVDKGYLKHDYSQRLNDYSYELKHKGRSYLVKNGYV